jgi:DNA end-binding protein Ku
VLPAPGDDRGMMAYTLRYKNELRDQTEYFRDIKQPPIDADSLQLAETLITKMSGKLDMGKFEDGYEVAVKALVEAKIKNMPLPVDTAPKQQPGNVINLMDALRKSVGADSQASKKPPKSEKEAAAKSIRLVKGQAKPSPKRKSA